jgi:hypothetical protein
MSDTAPTTNPAPDEPQTQRDIRVCFRIIDSFGNANDYRVERMPTCGGMLAAYRLTKKLNGLPAEAYICTLWPDGHTTCECPAGAKGIGCKHAWALEEFGIFHARQLRSLVLRETELDQLRDQLQAERAGLSVKAAQVQLLTTPPPPHQPEPAAHTWLPGQQAHYKGRPVNILAVNGRVSIQEPDGTVRQVRPTSLVPC